MSFSIDLPVEVGMRLQQEATPQGVPVAEIVQRLVTTHLPDKAEPTEAKPFAQWAEAKKPDATEAERKRIEAIDATIGKYAYLGPMVEDLHRERQADKEREERMIAGYMP